MNETRREITRSSQPQHEKMCWLTFSYTTIERFVQITQENAKNHLELTRPKFYRSVRTSGCFNIPRVNCSVYSQNISRDKMG